jgi:hypothetical protein
VHVNRDKVSKQGVELSQVYKTLQTFMGGLLIVSALIAGFQDGSRNGLGRWLQIDKSRRTQMLVLFFVPAVFMISWAAVNYAENGIFTVSIIG